MGWDRGEGSDRSEGRWRGVHPLFPAILSGNRRVRVRVGVRVR